ncbi:MAG: hypothetical protein DRM98_00450 [Thermoplasmata archaeon]|nr:MAG: hypothetical protein DRM98_00450 [Thermoplasmata archaeon]
MTNTLLNISEKIFKVIVINILLINMGAIDCIKRGSKLGAGAAAGMVVGEIIGGPIGGIAGTACGMIITDQLTKND